jgi:hypothetical protein
MSEMKKLICQVINNSYYAYIATRVVFNELCVLKGYNASEIGEMIQVMGMIWTDKLNLARKFVTTVLQKHPGSPISYISLGYRECSSVSKCSYLLNHAL